MKKNSDKYSRSSASVLRTLYGQRNVVYAQGIMNLRDVDLRKGKQSPFVITVPCDKRDWRNCPFLDEFLGIIHKK
jgi:hypothetical protein